MIAFPSSFVSEKQSGWWSMVMPVLSLPPRHASSSRLPGSKVLLPLFVKTGSDPSPDGSSQGDSSSPLLHDPMRNDSSHICPNWGAALSYFHGNTMPSSSSHWVPLGEPAMIIFSSALVAAT